jgi:FkbM family methyltransferase
MLTYDIGAYEALTSTFVASAVGAENVVIIEPSEVNWPNIRANWNLPLPRATFPGFMDATNKPGSEKEVYLNSFPPEANGSIRKDENLEFRWLHYRDCCSIVASRPALTLDTLASIVGIPQGFTMDAEGAELLVLRGAINTLRNHHPLVWVSIHPKFMMDRFKNSAEELHELMKQLGYNETLLAADHEEHWFFNPKMETSQ